jgi:hypothetical protein
VIGRTTQYLLLLLAASACGRSKPDGSPYARKVAEAIPKLEKTVGIKFKTPPRYEVRSRDDVRQFLERKFAEDLRRRASGSEQRQYALDCCRTR